MIRQMLSVGRAAKSRHLRAGNVRSYGLEEVVIFAPVFKISCGRAGPRSPQASRHDRLGRFARTNPCRRNCGRITGKRILYRIGRIPLLCD